MDIPRQETHAASSALPAPAAGLGLAESLPGSASKRSAKLATQAKGKQGLVDTKIQEIKDLQHKLGEKKDMCLA